MNLPVQRRFSNCPNPIRGGTPLLLLLLALTFWNGPLLAAEKPLGIQRPGNGAIIITEDCREIGRIEPKVYIGVNLGGVWASQEAGSGQPFLATGTGDENRGYDAVARFGGALVYLNWRAVIKGSTLHVRYSLVPKGDVQVLGVQAAMNLPYADWTGSGYELNGIKGLLPAEHGSSPSQWTIAVASDNPELMLGPSQGGLKLELASEGTGLSLFDARYYGPLLSVILNHNETAMTNWLWEHERKLEFEFTVEFNRPLIQDPDMSACAPAPALSLALRTLSQPAATPVPAAPNVARPPTPIPHFTSTFTSVPLPPTRTATPFPRWTPTIPKPMVPTGPVVGQRMPDTALVHAPTRDFTKFPISTNTPTLVNTPTRIFTWTRTSTPFIPTATPIRLRPTATPVRLVRLVPTPTYDWPKLPAAEPVRRVQVVPTPTYNWPKLPAAVQVQPVRQVPVVAPAAKPVAPVPAQAVVAKPAAPLPPKPLPDWFPPLAESQTVTILATAASIYVAFVDGSGNYELKIADGAGKILKIVFDDDAENGTAKWIYWDGKDEKKVDAPPGRYYLLLYKDGKAIRTIPVYRRAGQ